jgi:hypothetical protein
VRDFSVIIDLTCPLELRGYEILHDDGNNVRAYIALYNLLDKRIAHFDAVVRWVSAEYDEYEEMPFFADQLRASARTLFHISVSTQDMPHADRLEIHFLRICFEEDLPDWIGDPDRLIDIDLGEEPDGRTLNYLMSLAGRDAVRFPRKTTDYWICVCGHVNAEGFAQCRRCRRDKNTVLTALSREALLLEQAPPLPETLMPEPIEPDLPFYEDLSAPFAPDAPAEADEPELAEAPPKRYLLRNVFFMLAVLTVVCASLILWNWLSQQRDRAKDVRPPVTDAPGSQRAAADINE